MYAVDIPVSSVLDSNVSAFQIDSAKERIRSLQHDSRKARPGDWFICLERESRDGHHFISQAIQAGASRFIYNPEKVTQALSGLHVKDTVFFLGQLARIWREKFDTALIAITGSNGKTSTKELLHFLLQNIFADDESKLVRSPASYNNKFGLPFTLLQINENTLYTIVELGTNHPGEIAYLSKIALPDYAIITSIGKSHLGFFENTHNVAEEKADIVVGMPPNSCVWLPENTEHLDLIQKKAKRHQVSIQSPPQNILSAKQSSLSGTYFSYQRKEYLLPVSGVYSFENLKLIISLLERLVQKGWLSFQQVHTALSALPHFQNISGRMEIIKKDQIQICNDSYNANPTSFEKSIETLADEIPKDSLLGALGHMAELGSSETTEHIKLAKLVSRHFHAVSFFSPVEGIRQVFRETWLNMNREEDNIFTADTTSEDIQKGYLFLKPFLRESTCLFVKGSRSARMERILEYT